MASGVEGENVLDLYRIETKDLTGYKLAKIFSKTLIGNEFARFNTGAGVYLSDLGELRVVACGPHIRKRFAISVYE